MSVRFCYERLRRRPLGFRRVTGLSLPEFDEIVSKCKKGWHSKVIKPKKLDGRPYGVGGLEDHLLALLLYYRFPGYAVESTDCLILQLTPP